MSKIKLSFSFLLTLILVGMLSIVAFAAAPTAPTGIKGALDKKITTTPTGQHETEYDLILSWKAVTGADSYNVYLDGTKVTTVTDTTYTFTPLENKYSIEVEAVNADGTSPKGSFAWNTDVNITKATDDSENDNDLVNANQTGLGVGGKDNNYSDVIKSGNMKNKDNSVSTHKTHGSYANNTNSCASCHQTHTAASKNLLFKNGVYATCTACHDGTLGFYNVFSTGADASKSAGTFGGTESGNMSVHLATGAVAIKAAPGGNKTGEGSWAGEFTCASCHAPHGSYSDRLLHYNPNGIATTPVANGGQKLEDVPVVEDLTGHTEPWLVLRTKDLDSVAAASFPGLTAGATVVQLYKYNGTAGSYTKDTAPWVYTGTYDATHTYKVYDTALWKVKDSSTEAKKYNTPVATSGFIAFGKNTTALVSRQNFIGANTASGTDVALLNAVNVADIARAYVVKLDVTPSTDPLLAAKNVTETTAASLWGNTWKSDSVKHSGSGVVMSGFCSACHTDYLAKSGEESGTYSHAYRHTTTSDSYTCVRCHFAHGTDVTVMKDAKGKTAQDLVTDNTFTNITDANAYMLDKDPSSALKRFTNMSVCWGCHTSSHAEGLRNDKNYGDTSDDPIGGLPAGN